MNPLMLCIHMSSERALRLSFAAMSLGVRVKMVEPDQEGQTLAALCGLEPLSAKPVKAQAGEEMLVFAFLEDDLLECLLPALRNGMPPVRLKAVLTPDNRSWNCAQLYRELKGEAEALGKR
ncbi:MAG: DUF3783 domain-containing protein [Clostridia bacterium]|nr:DUF3783 domain-containing protein [Clostridia bacterium]